MTQQSMLCNYVLTSNALLVSSTSTPISNDTSPFTIMMI